MPKTILITGATDGIGLATAITLASAGHHVLLHGRNLKKLEDAKHVVANAAPNVPVRVFVADLSRLSEVEDFADRILAVNLQLDVLINNAGVYNARETVTAAGLDVRFVVNTIAPYMLTCRLMPVIRSTGRVINVSSAAQSPVDLDALRGFRHIADGAAYAQSKLALTMWSRHMAQSVVPDGPDIIAVNPGSMLGSKMVKQAFGVAGEDIQIGADILCRLAIDDAFSDASGKYFDNDRGRFSSPHADATDAVKSEKIVQAIEQILAEHVG